MKSWSIPTAAAVVAATIFFSLSTMALPAASAIVEHTFVVSQMTMKHLCKETPVTVVNGQIPGPTIEVTEGDSVTVHVVNKSPHNITIHWHGVKQRRNCWSDGVPMVTQCPILPNQNFTYRFSVAGQVGTLWWHAHVSCLRATLHGAIIIRPRLGASSTTTSCDIYVMRSELNCCWDWWAMDLAVVARRMEKDNFFDYFPSASTINGKLGDLFNCSGVPEDGFVLDVEAGKTYLLRIINTALFSEPYTTDLVVIAPGETIDALVVADAPPGKYYMVAMPNQAPLPDTQTPEPSTRATMQYSPAGNGGKPVAPVMPDQHDVVQSLYFHSNLSSLRDPRHPLPPVPKQVDQHLFITLGLGMACRRGLSCSSDDENDNMILVATMNNISFLKPTAALLPAHYYHVGSNKGDLLELPDKPPRVFNFTDPSLIPIGPKEKALEQTYMATLARWFRYGSAVEMGDSNPMHLHGHDMFVLAQGHGNFDAARDRARYNLVDPPLKNTVVVPNLGWVAIRFVADNPGVWYMHCHYEFHLAMGMTAVFIVEDGPTVNTKDSLLVPDESYLQTREIKASRIDGV
ncbi:hypothetical protein PVAP13_3NG041300 [Panicum virgatum]|uniref:Laccase n=1 Tax=Panicum virgatum TaxID=38727 RepID=A0A8T0U234_PANVG|nr:hypothetical protein PVAP13_3NG041300 [Panicum virgatum]